MNDSLEVSAIMCARNEAENLPKVLQALKQQTKPFNEIIVVDDGSIDATATIAKQYGCKLIQLKSHNTNVFLVQGGLAKRFNAGLITMQPCDYVFIMGADDVFPPNYIQSLLELMEANPKLVIASGQLRNQPTDPSAPRGGGRLVKTWFWKRISDLRFPVLWCWEGAMSYKANQLGYETKAFPNILFDRVRPDRGKRSPIKAFGDGKGMYALGFYWPYALLRCFYVLLRDRREAYFLFRGFMQRKGVRQVEFAWWVRKMQKYQLCHAFAIWNKIIIRLRNRVKK